MRSLSLLQGRFIPKKSRKRNETTIFVLCFLSLLFFILSRIIPLGEGDIIKKEMVRASEIMAEALEALRKCQIEKGIVLDEKADRNRTGLIGVEFSSITTSVGSLEAKRTTTNPNFAALLVYLLKKAGVKAEDTIAIGASSSFPALIVASLSAAKAMNIEPLMICSLGASQWGANNPLFHWLDIQNCLQSSGIFDVKPIALSLGGEEDTGNDMSPEGRSFLIEEAKQSQIPFLDEPNLEHNVQARIELYEEKAGRKKIKAFINIGGSWANMGTDSEILKLNPGLVRVKHFSQAEKRGLIAEMAMRKIPVIHLLYIKGLAQRFGLPWDPEPLPNPGKGKIYLLAEERKTSFFLLAGVYFLFFALVYLFRNKKFFYKYTLYYKVLYNIKFN